MSTEWSELLFGRCACGQEAIGPMGLCGACFVDEFEPAAVPAPATAETNER